MNNKTTVITREERLWQSVESAVTFKRTVSLKGETKRHQTAGSPFCHAKRPEGLGAGAERQSIQEYGSIRRLPQSCLLRNDGVLNLKEYNHD